MKVKVKKGVLEVVKKTAIYFEGDCVSTSFRGCVTEEKAYL